LFLKQQIFYGNNQFVTTSFVIVTSQYFRVLLLACSSAASLVFWGQICKFWQKNWIN